MSVPIRITPNIKQIHQRVLAAVLAIRRHKDTDPNDLVAALVSYAAMFAIKDLKFSRDQFVEAASYYYDLVAAKQPADQKDN